MVNVHLGFPCQIALFQPHGVHGIHAEHLDLEFSAGCHESFKNRDLAFDRVKDLIPELTDIIHAVDPALDAADVKRFAGTERQGFVGHVSVSRFGQQIPRPGTGNDKAALLVGKVFHQHRTVIGQVEHHPVLIVAFADTGGHAKIFTIPIPGDCHITFKSAVFIQHGAEGDAALCHRNLLAGHFVKPLFGTRSADSGFGESCQIKQADVVHHMFAFPIHILESIVAAPAGGFLAVGGRIAKIVGAFPAVVVAEGGPGRLLIFIDGAGTVGSRRSTPVVGENDAVKARIGIFDFFMVIGPGGIRTVTTAVHAPQVDFRFTVHQPSGNVVSDTAGLGDAKAVAAGQKIIFQRIGGADQRITVGRISDGSDGDMLKAVLAHNRKAIKTVFDVFSHMIDVGLQLALGVFPGHPFGIPLLHLAFVEAQNQTVHFLADVNGSIGVAHQRQHGVAVGDRINGFKQKMGVFSGDRRYFQTRHGGYLRGPQPGGVNHPFAGNVSLIGMDHPLTVRFLGQPGDPGMLVDFHTEFFGAQRHGLGDTAGVYVTVVRPVKSPQKPFDIHQRM